MKQFVEYLLHRFQVIPLTVLVASDVIVISRIADLHVQDWTRQAAVFGMVMCYLFSNRVGDDRRDHAFDLKHHSDRAIQQGKLSLATLERLGNFALAAMVILAYTLSPLSLLLVFPVWAFSWWAKRDFSLPTSFKEERFFTYNFLNMLQMLVLQIFVYLSLLGHLRLTGVMWIHILFVFVLSLQIEVTRKIQPVKSSGQDLYSDRLGMAGSMWLWLLLGCLAIGCSSVLAYTFGATLLTITLAACLWLLGMSLAAYVFYRSRNAKMEKVFWAGTIFSYVGQNVFLAYV